jgi:hypothetical protein
MPRGLNLDGRVGLLMHLEKVGKLTTSSLGWLHLSSSFNDVAGIAIGVDLIVKFKDI